MAHGKKNKNKPVRIPIEDASGDDDACIEMQEVTEPLNSAFAGLSEDVLAWIGKNPTYRNAEIAYLAATYGSSSVSVAANGGLQCPVMVGSWCFLLVLDDEFPKAAEDGSCVKMYFVNPMPGEIASMMGLEQASFATVDASGNPHILFKGFDEELSRYLSGKSKVTLSQQAVETARRLHGDCMEKRQGALELERPVITGSKYLDARGELGEAALNPRCKKVVLSSRAYIQIYNETRAHIKTETGGLLLGHYENGIWYVVESSDPGWNAVFQVSYHEADENYANHVCTILSRTYKHPLAFLGMWHRHPGSLDTFSGTDDATNSKYVDACGNGCISLLVNYDPDFRLTVYYVERSSDGDVRYSLVDVEVGDDLFANPEMLAIADISDADERIAREQAQAAAEKDRRTLRSRKKKDVAAETAGDGQGQDGEQARAAGATGPVKKQPTLSQLIFGIKL